MIQDLGIKFRNLRKQLGLTTKAISQWFGVTNSTVQNWEEGINDINGSHLILFYLLYTHPELATDMQKLNERKENYGLSKDDSYTIVYIVRRYPEYIEDATNTMMKERVMANKGIYV